MVGKKKRALRRDIRATFRKSKGRFLSIVCLIALGSFALVGLKVAGPDMRATSRDYFDSYDMADLVVIGDLGIDSDDRADIERLSGTREIEYGYLKDLTVKGTSDAVRIESKPTSVSRFEVSDGRLPEADDEIAVDSFMADDYPTGSTIEFDEKESDGGTKTLTRHNFTVVGHVNSVDIIADVNKGSSTVGTGDLTGYAVVMPDVFDVDYYMTCRVTFEDTEGRDPYSAEYLSLVSEHRDELSELLSDAPERRLAAVRDSYDEKISEGQGKVDSARKRLRDAKASLDDAAAQLSDGRATLADSWETLEAAAAQLSQARETLSSSATSLSGAQATLASARKKLDASEARYESMVASLESSRSEVESRLSQAQGRIDSSRSRLESGKRDYQDGIERLETGVSQLAQAVSQLEGTIALLDEKLADETISQEERAELQARRAEAQDELDRTNVRLSSTRESLEEIRAVYERFLDVDADLGTEGDDGGYTKLIAALDKSQAELERERVAARGRFAQAEQELVVARSAIRDGEASYAEGLADYEAAKDAYGTGVAEYNDGLVSYQTGLVSYRSAEGTLAGKQSEYEESLATYEGELPDALRKIDVAQDDLGDAAKARDKVVTPSYDVDTRRETPGSEGYRTYDSVSEIVDSLANIFPYFLYLVAALVASTTMTRMVDEERINAGTLKALGYHDRDVMRKFVVYGATAGGIGSVLGIALGHTLLPMIVYGAYGAKFSVPSIELRPYPLVSVAALALGLAVSVIPALLSACRELGERPAQLLLPKPPATGSKILLERVTPVWSRMGFTQKVTCRNLLRYKRRMAMTVIGVAGAVCLMFAGYAVRHSIQGLSEAQFGEIIKYDLIVAEKSTIDSDERDEIDALLDSDEVNEHSAVMYEAVSKVAGDKGDEQSITLLVPEDEEGFTKYLSIRDRASGEAIALPDDGCVISERLANLTGTKVGDELTFTDSDGVERTTRVSGICEMYMNHFMFMGPRAYESCTGKSFSTNAHVIALSGKGGDRIRKVAAEFIELDGVLGCVQSARLVDQVNVVVTSLNKIMMVLVGVAVLLAVVIVYNLVTINVAERIRELSTIKVLGFRDREVSMYIYRETIVNSLIALPVGWFLGWLLQQYIITAVPPEEIMFDPACGTLPFVVSTLVVVSVTLVMYLVVNGQLKRVDMLEALKSVE